MAQTLRRSLRRSLAFVPLLVALAVAALLGNPWLPEARGDKDGKKLSVREMKKKMNGWARELGVKCEYCHVKQGDEFDYEAETPKKKIGHYCEENFVERMLTADKKQVSCQDCHNKKARFLPRDPEQQ